MKNVKLKKEINEFIIKYQKEDVNEKLGKIIGKDFVKYREDFNKTQDYLNTKFIPDFPISIYIEPLNRCNLNCIMCYKKHHSETRSELSLETIEKIINECKENKAPSFMLALGSEILLYKDIKKVFDMTGEAGILDVFIGTNAVLMTDEIIESIVKNKFSRVEISLDAATAETYSKIRRGAPALEKVENNIKKLIACKKKHGSPLPVIRLCFVTMDINKHEAEQFIEKWKDQVDYIDFQRHFDATYIDNLIEVNKEEIKNSFCSNPFFSLSVWADGSVTPCCHYLGRKMVLGNIKDNTLKEIWHGAKIKEIRGQIANKKFNKICSNCLYHRDRNFIDKIDG